MKIVFKQKDLFTSHFCCYNSVKHDLFLSKEHIFMVSLHV